MFSLSSLASRFFSPFTCTGTVHSLWSLRRPASSTSQDNDADPGYLSALKKQDPAAYRKWRYHNDQEYRQNRLRAQQRYRRRPDVREQKIAAQHLLNRSPKALQYERQYDRASQKAGLGSCTRPSLLLNASTTIAPLARETAFSGSGGPPRLTRPLISAILALPATLISWSLRANTRSYLGSSPLLIIHHHHLQSHDHSTTHMRILAAAADSFCRLNLPHRQRISILPRNQSWSVLIMFPSLYAMRIPIPGRASHDQQ
ncbi:hypothetical protein KCU71_g143, partial [Aureobasidium melanogenum]